MTTRFKDDDLTEGLTGAIHETGHALYEQGRNLDYDGLPVNQVAPLAQGAEPSTADTSTLCPNGRPKETVQMPQCLQNGLHGLQAYHSPARACCLPASWTGCSVLQALSMGVHESQSLLWERMVALSLPFSRYLAPKLAAAFPQLGDLQVHTAGNGTALQEILLALRSSRT